MILRKKPQKMCYYKDFKMPNIKDNRTSKLRTICEVHREIYDKILEDKTIKNKTANNMINLLNEAYIMAKKMNNKLRQYKHNYDDDWWQQNRNFKESFKRRNIK